MTTMQSTMTPAAGFLQRETRFPKPQAGSTARAAPPLNPQEKRRTNPLVPYPSQDFDDDDWVCWRSID